MQKDVYRGTVGPGASIYRNISSSQASASPAVLLLITTLAHLYIPIKIQDITAARATRPRVITTPYRFQITAQTQYPGVCITVVPYLMSI